MTTKDKIYIIGIGNDGLAGLTTHAREIIDQAEVLLGPEAILKLLPAPKGEVVRTGSDPQELVRIVEGNLGRKRQVVLGGGDPLFYGVARYLCDRLGKDRFEVLAHVSSMQLAFARIKESWEEAYLTNLATHPLDTILDRIRTAETVGLFTSEKESPPMVARTLLARGLDYFRAFVCENLGAPDERVTQGELDEIAGHDFSPLNVMILKRKPDRPDLPCSTTGFRRFGNPDDVFAQSRPKSGLITQAEIRAIALSQLDLQPGCVVWDIGAGSGSVAIEAAQLVFPGMVYAIEQDVADYHLIVANAQTFGVRNVTAIHGTAQNVAAELPAPDAVFVGGDGKEVAMLLEAGVKALRPGGRLVAHVGTLETLNATYSTLKRLAPPVEVLLINMARGTEQLDTLRFESLNPTFLLRVVRRV